MPKEPPPRRPDNPTPTDGRFTRRGFLKGGSLSALGAALLGGTREALAAAAVDTEPVVLGPGAVAFDLRVNGTTRQVAAEPNVTLLDLLRERLHLTGTKMGCNHGACGACTVHVDGQRVNSCLALAVMQRGREIQTIEGLAKGDTLHPMQAAFIECDAFQCGFCTSGQIMSAVSCLREGHAGSDTDIREWMSGNLCRCGAYNGIVEAIKSVRDTARGAGGGG